MDIDLEIIQQKIAIIKLDSYYDNSSKDNTRIMWFLINDNYKLHEIKDMDEFNLKYAKYYLVLIIYQLFFDMGYSKYRVGTSNYEIIVLDKNLKQTEINCNGWNIRSLETFGSNSWGDITRTDLKFRFVDIHGNMSNEVCIREQNTNILDKIKRMMELLQINSEKASLTEIIV